MTITIKTMGKRPATLSNVVDALEAAETSLDITLAAAPQGTKRYMKVDEVWREVGPVAAVTLRMQFERNGFKPVSKRMLFDALSVARLPTLGAQ